MIVVVASCSTTASLAGVGLRVAIEAFDRELDGREFLGVIDAGS